jgi:hypothetical protein
MRVERKAELSSSTMSQAEDPPPVNIPYTRDDHYCYIPHYLYRTTNPDTLNGSEKFWLVKIGREVGLHIDV